jgi:hypothetical protein
MYAGAHITVEFSRGDVVDVIVLQVAGDELLVQEQGTRRAEWCHVSQVR